MRQTRQEVEFSERRCRRGSKQGGLRPSRRIVSVSQFSPSSERAFFIYNHLYYQELSRKYINFYLSAVLERALKTAQIYTDLINDWIQIGYYSIVLKSVSMLLKCNYEEFFIRQFYLDRNSFGYYRVYFIDSVTGIRDSGKSTHTKYKVEATMITTSWLQNVAPDCVFTSNR